MPAPPPVRIALRCAAMNLAAALLAVGAAEAGLRAWTALRGADPAGRRADERPHGEFRWFSTETGPDGKPEFDTLVRLNRHGFHGPDHPPRRAPGARRVAVVGDSFIEAWQVTREEHLASRLEARLPGVECLSFGRNAFSTTRQRELLDRLPALLDDGRGPDLPDLVLFQCHGPFALRQALGDSVHPPAAWRRWASAALFRARSDLLAPEALRRAALRRLQEPVLAARGELDRLYEPGHGTEDLEAAWRIVGEAVADLAARCRERGMAPAFFYLPTARETRPPGRDFDPGFPARRFRALVEAAGAPWIDLAPGLRGDGIHFPVDGHLTPRGHDRAAALLAERLPSLLPPR